jgi:hypothetical protein
MFAKTNSSNQNRLQLQKSQPSFPNLDDLKFHLSLSKLQKMEPDGNCLFRAMLAAQGLNDSSHLELRSRCADSVVAEWNNYAAYANFSHKPDTNIRSKNPLSNENEPSLDLLFKDANDYSSYIKRNGIYGSYLRKPRL